MVTILTLGIGTVIGMFFIGILASGKRAALEMSLLLAKQEVKELAKANAFLLMEKHKCGLGVIQYKCQPLPSLPEHKLIEEEMDTVCDAIDRGEGMSPRFVLNPNKKEWDPEGNHHVRHYINDVV